MCSYPNVPPKVNLQTTGKGEVRFNPNLYNCGKVCLSLLGTWSGAQGETWNEQTSTLLQVLVSIQSLIFVKDPYYNEPGYERSMGSPGATAASHAYSLERMIATVRWGMLDHLQHPRVGYEEVVKLHFKLKKKEILQQVWMRMQDDM